MKSLFGINVEGFFGYCFGCFGVWGYLDVFYLIYIGE